MVFRKFQIWNCTYTCASCRIHTFKRHRDWNV